MANKNYSDMTKVELLELCETLGLEVSKRMIKDDIIALIKENEKPKKASEEKAEPSEESAPKEEAAKPNNSRKQNSKNRSQRQKNEKAQRDRAKKTRQGAKEAAEKSEATPDSALRPRIFDSAPPVHMIDEEDAGTNMNPEYNKYDVELMVSKEDPLHYLTGIISGSGQTTYQRVGERTIAYVNALVQFGNRTVMIPSFQFFEDWSDESKYDQTGWYKYMQERIGSEVDFNVIMRDDGPVPDYYGTRFFAMKKRRCDRWYAKVKDGNWYFKENQLVQARVVASRESGLVIDIEGAETFIPKSEVAHEFVNSARDYYQVGDKVVVAISDIRRENVPQNTANFSFPITYRASIKKATLDPRQIYFQDFQKGSTHLATVRNITVDKDRAVFYCNVEGKADIYCWMREGVRRIPNVGDSVIVKVSGSDADSKRIWGAIIHIVTDTKNKQEFTVLNI